MLGARVCECGEAEIKFHTEDAGKFLNCQICGREYEVFLEVNEHDETLYELVAEPTQTFLLG